MSEKNRGLKLKIGQLEPFPKVVDLDPLDRNILKILQENAKITLREMQEIIEIHTKQKHSLSTLKARIDHLSEKKVIEDYIAVINCNRIGYREMLHFYIQVKAEVKISDVVDKLLDISEINVIYLMAGEDPIFCIAKCVGKPEQINLIERIKGVVGIEKIRTQVVIQRIKEDMRVSIPDLC